MKLPDNTVVLDVESGGLDPNRHSILSVGLVRADGKSIQVFVMEDPIVITPRAMQVNRIDLGGEDFYKKAKSPAAAGADVADFLAAAAAPGGKTTLAGHNVAFDVSFLKRLFRLGNVFPDGLPKYVSHRCVDTSSILWSLGASGALPVLDGLDAALAHFNIVVPEEQRHTGLGDALATKALLEQLLDVTRPLAMPGPVSER